MKLSNRLQTLADYVQQGDNVIDVGCDHGKLSCYLLHDMHLVNVIASDIEVLPVEACKKTAARTGLTERLTIVQYPGLAALNDGYSANTAIISGMGGHLISTILEQGPIQSLTKLILQPNNGAYTLRGWLQDNGFLIVDEALVLDNKIIYEVIVAIPGEQHLSYEEQLLGPCLLKQYSQLFIQKWEEQLHKFQKLVQQIPTDEDKAPLLKRIETIEKALKKQL